MQLTFLRGIFLIVLLNLLVKPFWLFGIERTVHVEVGNEMFGLYGVVLNLSLIFNILLDLGINPFNNRMISREPELLPRYMSSILTAKLALTGVYVLTVMLIGFGGGYGGFRLQLLFVLGLNQVLLSFILYFRTNVTALHLFRAESLLSVADRLLMIVFCGVLLWGNVFGGRFRIEWFVYAQTLSYGLTLTGAVIFLWPYMRGVRLTWDKGLIRGIVLSSLPFSLMALLMDMYRYTDNVMLELLLPGNAGEREVGYYLGAYRLLMAVNAFAYLFGSMLMPIFSRMFKNEEPIKDLLRTSALLLLTPVIVLCCVFFFYDKDIMYLLYDDPTLAAESTRLVGWLMLSLVPFSGVYIYGTLLTAYNDLRFLNTISAAGLVVNVVVNLILIPEYGAFGAVIATIITQFVVAGGQVVRAHGTFGIAFLTKTTFRVVAYTILSVFLFYVSEELPGGRWLKLAVLCGLCLTFAVLFKMLNIRLILESLKTRAE